MTFENTANIAASTDAANLNICEISTPSTENATNLTIESETAAMTTTAIETIAPATVIKSGPPAVGDINTGKVVAVLKGKDKDAVPHAILLSFGSATGILRDRDFNGNADEKRARLTSVKRGDEFTFMVVKVSGDGLTMKFDLSERQASNFNHVQALVDAKQEVEGTVLNTTAFGVFIDIGNGNTGLLHVSEISSNNQATRLGQLKSGDIIKTMPFSVKIDPVNTAKLRIELSELDAALQKSAKLAGSIVTGRILGESKGGGIKIALKDGVEGVLPLENLGESNISAMQKGNNLQVKIVGITGRALLLTREGIGGASQRAKHESQRAARRLEDAAKRSAQKGASGGGKNSGGGKGKK